VISQCQLHRGQTPRVSKVFHFEPQPPISRLQSQRLATPGRQQQQGQ
jgi:hypothetical protein